MPVLVHENYKGKEDRRLSVDSIVKFSHKEPTTCFPLFFHIPIMFLAYEKRGGFVQLSELQCTMFRRFV